MADLFASIITFFGTVQGVGFRRRAANIAARFPVAGYVKNLSNGTVELFVEGSEHECQDFVDQLKRDMCHEIASFDTKITTPKGFQEFSILH